MTDEPGSPAIASSSAPYAPRVRSIACHQCRSRKTKCSGQRPCTSCERANQAAECVYPQKDRLVKVSQRYIDKLIAENQELRRRKPCDETSPLSHGPTPGSAQNIETAAPESSPHDTEVPSTPWFVYMAVPHTPILLAEASDSAFATRFRQSLSTSEQYHFPRISYPPDHELQSLSDIACEWPSPPEARLLVNASLQKLGRWHHVVRRSVVLKELAEIIQRPEDMDSVQRCKFWALCAIGKMHATRASSLSEAFPGLAYFAKAMRILRDMSERPTIETVETCLLLSYYSLCLNRRHSAYNLAGLAVRTGVIMGLHLNIPANVLTDPNIREHRTRVWWTAYIFDRLWATKLGYPVTIHDDDIGIDMPSNEFENDDFTDPTYLIAMISLSRISGQITRSIYGGNIRPTPLSQRVNDCLQALRKWLEDLPASLKFHSTTNDNTSQASISLNLLFNQLTILATRPVLLHVFRTRFDTNGTGSSSIVPASASALCASCIRCARNSHQILEDAWFSGSFMLYDYFYTQNLFLTAVILAISSLLKENAHQSDLEHFDTLSLLLLQLRDSGNFVAAEFKQHIDAIKPLLHTAHAKLSAQKKDSEPTTGLSTSDPLSMSGSHPAVPNVPNDVATNTELYEPFFYDFLAQPLPDLDFIDASLDTDSSLGFYWPKQHPHGDKM